MWIVRYRAPELLDPANAKRKDCSYTDAVDTWSWGCVLYEMLSGQLYMAEKDLEHSHLHIAASHEHQKKKQRIRNVHHPRVSHRRERCRKDETKAWSVMLEMKQREAGFVPQPAAAPVVPDM